jgi:hypothetical protein
MRAATFVSAHDLLMSAQELVGSMWEVVGTSFMVITTVAALSPPQPDT